MGKTFTAESLALTLKGIIGHTGDLNIVVDGKRIESVTVNDNNEIELKLIEVQPEPFEIIDDGRLLTVKGGDLELTYVRLWDIETSFYLNVSYGQVGDTHVQASRGPVDYWIKVGRGTLKKEVQERIKEAESFLADKGFSVEAFKPDYRL